MTPSPKGPPPGRNTRSPSRTRRWPTPSESERSIRSKVNLVSGTIIPPEKPVSASSESVRPVAVVDVGTSSIRMAIAEVDDSGRVRPLETLSQGVSLGKDTFTKGSIESETIEECVRVLQAYRDKLVEYAIDRPEQIRVVATSAVREAANQLAFLDRIYIATGLTVQPVDEAEVHRITYRSIQPLLKAEPQFANATTIICEVGGGSTELLVVERGNVKYSHSFRLGSLRLRQTLQALRASQAKLREIMELEIQQTLEDLPHHVSSDLPVRLLALGGDIRFAADRLVPHWEEENLGTISLPDLERLCDDVIPLSDDAIVREFHLTLPEAETLGPALLVYVGLARILGLDEVKVTGANLRDGLLREMGDESIWTEDFRNQIIRSALELGRKCQFDEAHAVHVANLSRDLFIALREEHGLDERAELILYLAALLHEIGNFVSHTSMHKHSMYLIQNSELFGLSPSDVLLVALVARYHRRASPKPTHQGFNTLDRDQRVAVSKLAAMLRIAIALDASRNQRINGIECTRERKRLIITVPHRDDVSVEQLALRNGRSLFEEIYGREVMLRTRIGEGLKGPSSQL
ncbi:MAG: Ppx/GppA family phosphatase [Planctomycetota bacterium]|nr:MAG: Ppx/GppA family phosphatase [Planctomycetota bacterium]